MKYRNQTQTGSMPLVAIVVIAVVIVAALGFAAWRVVSDASNPLESVANQAAIDACAKENDKDICKFYTSWKIDTKYRVTSTDPGGTSSIFEVDGNKSRIKTSGQMEYEVITIDQTTYTKAGSVWYKQTIKDPTQDVSKDYKADFKDPGTSNTTETTASKTTYKSLGKEACGKLTCFKYEVSDTTQTDVKEFIWFDDSGYRLQKSRTETSTGVSEQTYEYDNISINVPSPVKELGADQYIVPGQTEPVKMPSATDYNL